MGIAVKM